MSVSCGRMSLTDFVEFFGLLVTTVEAHFSSTLDDLSAIFRRFLHSVRDCCTRANIEGFSFFLYTYLRTPLFSRARVQQS
jgi:hypothetical protein